MSASSSLMGVGVALAIAFGFTTATRIVGNKWGPAPKTATDPAWFEATKKIRAQTNADPISFKEFQGKL